MKDGDFANGIYWILHAIDYKLGGGYDVSAGIDYKNDVFETFGFWGHCECTCDVQEWGNVTQGEELAHASSCDFRDYGFKHFESGLEVEWYKRVGRSTESNKSMKTLDWFNIVVECLESVHDD